MSDTTTTTRMTFTNWDESKKWAIYNTITIVMKDILPELVAGVASREPE